MDAIKLKKELNEIYKAIHNGRFTYEYQIQEAFYKLISYNEHLLEQLVKDNTKMPEPITNIETDSLEKHFINGVHEIINNGATLNVDILNWYRNLYYKEGKNTERGIIAHAINNLFMEMKVKGIELSGLYTSPLE